MAEKVGSIYWEADLDDSKLTKGVENASNKIKNFGDGLKSLGTTLTASLTLPIVAAGAASIKAASDYNESLNKVDVAFGKNSDAIRKFSENSLHFFGVSKGEALDMAALFGDMGTSMGLATDEMADMSQELVGLAGDLASFKNIGIGQAQTALAGIFTGETESLKQLGIVMTDVNLKEFARAQGIKKTMDKMTQAEKVQLRYEYVMSKTTNAQGDFMRTMGGTANQIRIFQESLKEVAIEFGQIIEPIFNKIISKINEWVQGWIKLDRPTKELIIKIALVVAAIGPLIFIVGSLMSAIGTALPVITAIGAVLFSWVGVIALVVAGITYLAYKFGLLNTIIQLVKNVFVMLQATWNNIVLAFQSPQVQEAIGRLSAKFEELTQKFKPLFDRLQELLAPLIGASSEGGAFISVEQAISAIIFVIDGLIGAINFLMPIIEGLVNSLIWLINTGESVVRFFMNFKQNMGIIFEFIKNFIILKINEIGAKLLNFFTVTIPFLIGSAIRWFLELPAKIPGILTSVLASIVSMWNSAKTFTVNAVMVLVQNAISFFQQLPGRLRSIWNEIVSWLSTQPGQFARLGSEVINGFLSGLQSAMKGVMSWVKNQVDKIKNSFASGLKIKSPSKVFEYYGQMVGEGFNVGVDDAMREVSLKGANIGAKEMGTGSGSISNTGVNITVNMDGILAKDRNSLRAIGADIIEAVNETLRAKGIAEIGGGAVTRLAASTAS